MSDNVVNLRGSWQLVADVSDRISNLLDCIPGWDYEYLHETESELQHVALLLRQAVPLLERASEREGRRYVGA
jgi:hypothetical protein